MVNTKEGDTKVKESTQVLDQKVSKRTMEVVDEKTGKKTLRTFEVCEKIIEHEVDIVVLLALCRVEGLYVGL